MENGRQVSMPEIPLELLSLRYRQVFNLSYEEYCATPWSIVERDLAILSLEETYKSKKRRFAKKA